MSNIYGLHKRGLYYVPNYKIPETDVRLRRTTGETKLNRAIKRVERKIQEVRDEIVYGMRPKFTFKQAAEKYLNEYSGATEQDTTHHIYMLLEYIGDMELTDIYLNKYENGVGDGCPELIDFIQDRFAHKDKTIKKITLANGDTYMPVQGKDTTKKKTINNTLEKVRHILKLAAKEWRSQKLTWTETANLVRLLNVDDATPSKIISWDDQKQLMKMLPAMQADMVQYKVNTGCRATEVCHLQWQWEKKIAGLDRPVFMIPPLDDNGKRIVKNGKPRLVILNDLAWGVIEKQRGKHKKYVFAQKNGKPLTGLLTTSFDGARQDLGLNGVTVHGLKRTFGARLRASGVPWDDRVELLGHSRKTQTEGYDSAGIDELYPPSIKQLIDAANRVIPDELRLERKPELILVK